MDLRGRFHDVRLGRVRPPAQTWRIAFRGWWLPTAGVERFG
jgi:hypothetical protein